MQGTLMMIRTPSLWPAILLGALIVVDGDTVKLDGKNYRLLGFDTPETYRALCQAEYQAGIAAGNRLKEIIAAGATLHPTGKSCKYGRECAYLILGKEDVAEIMVREGYAVAYSGRGPRKNWCPSSSD